MVNVAIVSERDALMSQRPKHNSEANRIRIFSFLLNCIALLVFIANYGKR